MAQFEDKERAGVLSTVNRHTTFLDSAPILRSTSHSTFNARELLEGNMTIYLILPPHQIEAQARWLRLVITALIRLIGREAHTDEAMNSGKECFFVLDEAGTALGYMPAIEQGLTLLRSYGLKMAFFFRASAS
jgi:type IV secretion system protein VirD4